VQGCSGGQTYTPSLPIVNKHLILWETSAVETLWSPSGFFRLVICHANSDSGLAVEIAKQLPNFGFACRLLGPEGSEALATVDATLATMEGFVALLTPSYFQEPLCNQFTGVAVGRGIHVQAVEVSCEPLGVLRRVPTIARATNRELPRLIAHEVARDPLSSRRLSAGAVVALANCDAAIESQLPSLEAVRFPSSDAVVELRKFRHAIREHVESETVRKIDRLIEKWQEQILSDAL
jgi:hypothetical protein